MSDDIEVQISPDADTLAAAVAGQVIALLARGLAANDVAHLVVTGGSILEKVQAALADPDALDWSRVHLWWGDERFVPATDDDRNDLPPALAALPVVQHRMAPSDGDYADADAAAQAYAAELRTFAAPGADVPSFDAALIGIGPDGHCCSLFPHHPVLAVLDRSVSAVYESPKPPPTRLTLTFPTLGAVRELYFVASGEGKADAVAAALGGSPTEETPSGTPRGTEHTLWLIDAEASLKLPRHRGTRS